MTQAAFQGTGVDRENPWPGLAAFTEEISEFFYGREAETQDLFRLVKRETLTILFGQSGLGKSSLLQAGLTPKLRGADFLPVYLRLDHAVGGAPLAEQVKGALRKKIEAKEADGALPEGEGRTLWEDFHHKETEFWTPKNQLATPVLIFDQFEEIFTLGRANEAARLRGEAFIEQLADLIENRMPVSLRQRINDGAEKSEDYIFDDPCCKILLSLREDYLPELEGLRGRIRSIMQNRMRIRRMNGAQALEVVAKGGGDLVEAGVAPWIVHFVSTAGAASENAAAPSEHMEELEVEPALLSIFCRELNNKRRRQGHGQITADLLKESRKGILSDFYQHSVEDLPEQVRIFVEDKLLTASGIRDNCALENALLEPGVTREVLERLVTRRLLRLDDRQGVQRVELTHDVLAAPIRASRDERQHRLALARSREREQEARRKLGQARQRIALYIAVAGLLVSAPLLWYAFHQQSEAMRQRAAAMEGKDLATREQNKAVASAKEAKENLDLASKVLADYYALKVQLALQQSPPDALVAEMLLRHAVAGNTFEHADLVDLFLPPAPFAAEKSVKLDHAVSRLAYSPDGTTLAALGDDGVQLIDAATGKAATWIPPEDLAKSRIREVAFEPWNPRLWVRLGEMGGGDVLVRWDCLKKEEVLPRLRLTKWPAGAPKAPAEGGKAPGDLRAAPAPEVGQKEPEASAPAPLPFAFDPEGKTIAAAGPEGYFGLFPISDANGQGKYVDLVPAKTAHATESPAEDSLFDGEARYPVGLSRPTTKPAGVGSLSVTALSYSKDGRILLVQSGAGTTSWDASTLDSAGSHSVEKPSATQIPGGLAASATGERFCTILNSPTNAKATLWRFYSDTLEPTHLEYDSDRTTITEAATITAAGYSIDGRWLALGTVDRGIHIFSSDWNRPLQALPVSGRTTALAFRPDGLGLVNAVTPLKAPSEAQAEGVTLQFWKLGPRESSPLHRIGDSEIVQAVSPSGQWLLGSSRRSLHVFETATGKLQATYAIPEGGFDELALRDDRHAIACTHDGKELVVREIASEARELLRLKIGNEPPFLALSPDGGRLAVGGDDDKAMIYDLGSGGGSGRQISVREPGATRPATAAAPATAPEADLFDTSGQVYAAFSHDNRKLAIFSPSDEAVRQFAVEDGRFLSKTALPSAQEIGGIAYSGDDAALLYSGDERLVCFDLALARPIAEIRRPGYFSRISVSRDNGICVVDDYAPNALLVRPSVPAGLADLQAAARRKLDAHHNAVPFAPAEGDTAITPPDAFMANYWAGWWEMQRRLELADHDPGAVLTPGTLVRAYEPLKPLFDRNASRPLPSDLALTRDALRKLEPLKGPPTEEEVGQRIAFLDGRMAIERVVLLRDLLEHLDAASRQRAMVTAGLAKALAQHVDDVKWGDGAAERETETAAALDALRQAMDLGYGDWKEINSSIGTGPLRTDARYAALFERMVRGLAADAPERAAAFAQAGYAYVRRVQNASWDAASAPAKRAAVDKAYDLVQQAVALGYKDWHEVQWQLDRYDYDGNFNLDARLPEIFAGLLARTPADDTERQRLMAELAAAYARRADKVKWTSAETAEKETEARKAIDALRQAIVAGFKDWGDISGNFGDALQADARFPLEVVPDKDLIALAGRLLNARTRESCQQAVRVADAGFARGMKAFHLWYYKGAALSRLERYADALSCLKEAAPLAPDAAWKSAAYRELSTAERHLDKLDDALDDANTALDMAESGSRSAVLANRARVYFEMNRDDDAVRDLNRIVSENPDDADAYDWKGTVLLQYPRERFMDDAAAAYTRALELTKDPADRSDFLEQRALAYRYDARFNEALADIDSALRDDSENDSIISDRAIVRAALGHPREAIADYTRALVRTPDDPWLLARRGLARLETGDTAGAKDDFAAAMKGDDSDDCSVISEYMDVICDAPVSLAADAEARLARTPGAADALARFRLKQGKKEEAAQILAGLLKTNPNRILFRAYAGQADSAIDDAVRYYNQDSVTSSRAYTAAVALLARAAAPDAPADRRAADCARALFYLGRWTGGTSNDWYSLQHDWDFRALTDDAAFAQLVAAQKQPGDKWNRAFERARFFAQTHKRLKEIAPLEAGYAFDAALDELERARKQGAGVDMIAAQGDFAELHSSPRYADLIKPAP